MGIDYAELNDWAAVNLHFRRGDTRYDINRAWICAQSKTLTRIKAPWQTWCDIGECIYVDDVSISPYLLTDYIREAARKYNIKKLALDHFRYTMMAEALQSIGFDAKDKNRVKLIRPSDIMQVDPSSKTALTAVFLCGATLPSCDGPQTTPSGCEAAGHRAWTQATSSTPKLRPRAGKLTRLWRWPLPWSSSELGTGQVQPKLGAICW